MTLAGNVHPLARPEFDRGAAPPDLRLDRMQLVLQRSAEQQAELDTLTRDQQLPDSADYQHWLTPEEFGQRFGAADEDISALTAWLESHGFRVDEVAIGRGSIEFSGTAGQVQEAFHSPIHKFLVGGKEYWANSSDPDIPAALADVVAGVANLNGFFSQPLHVRSGRPFSRPTSSSPRPYYSLGWYYNALAPADYAVIYNLYPLYQAGITGTGATIGVIGRSNINVTDVNDFRRLFGLSVNPPQVVLNGADPGDLGGDEEFEAVLDNSWSGAVAPGATVKFVVSASTNTSDGTYLSEQYIVNHNSTVGADVMTMSFGYCEYFLGSSTASLLSSLAQQGAVEGITFMVSTGDTGSAGCDYQGEAAASYPLSVNGLGSSPYITAVGGTQFNENVGSGPYWSESNMNAYYLTAYKYIPEDAWNQSCATGAVSCTSANIIAGGGGASIYFSKPSWQTGVAGIPSDNARDVPDVSLAASGAHDPYLVCIDGGCATGVSTPNFQGVGGTSCSSPAFAGIMALVRQKMGVRQGAANPVLYKLAASETLSGCNGSTGAQGASCIFNDVTVGNNDVPGETGYGGATPSYKTGVGYDLATGLGSVNAMNLVNQWGSAHVTSPPIIVSVSPNPMTGSASSQTLTVNGTGFQTGAGLQLVVGYTNNITSLNGVAITSSSATQIKVSINVGTTARLWAITVINGNGTASNTVTFPVNAPPPAITSIGSITASASAQTLTINGTGFQSGAALDVVASYGGYSIVLNGASITSVTATQIQVTVNVGTTARNWVVAVFNPDGSESNLVGFAVSAPPASPVITSVSPSPMTGSASSQTLTVNGTGFQTGAGLQLVVGYPAMITSLNGAAITSSSATQIKASINVGTTARLWAITVINGNGAGSNTATFQVNAPAPSTPGR